MSPIRDAVAADRAAMADLWVEAWQAALPQMDFEARRDWLGTHLDGLAAEHNAVLVACHETEIVGFITVAPDGYVDQLAVARHHQGHGFARALLAAARHRSAQPLRLSVNTDNARAVTFYRTLGFVETGRDISTRSGLPIIHMRDGSARGG